MITARITIDGNGYYGEDPDQSYRPEHGQELDLSACGHAQADRLRIEHGTGKPTCLCVSARRQVEGCLCIKTELEKILRYVKDGEITPREIRVMMVIR